VGTGGPRRPAVGAPGGGGDGRGVADVPVRAWPFLPGARRDGGGAAERLPRLRGRDAGRGRARPGRAGPPRAGAPEPVRVGAGSGHGVVRRPIRPGEHGRPAVLPARAPERLPEPPAVLSR